MSTKSNTDAPNYDVEVQADDLITDLAERATEYATDYEKKRRWWLDSPPHDEFVEARDWMQEARGGQRAVGEAIAALQPENHSVLPRCYRNADGTVDVRGFMAWLSRQADRAHEASSGPHGQTRHADESETAFAKMLSLLRDEYDVGFPRFDDLGGVLEEDLP